MSTQNTLIQNTPTQNNIAQKVFLLGTRFWFCSLVIAQACFVIYLSLGYGLASIEGQLGKWNTFNNTAYIANDTLGNLFYGLHVLLAIVMISGGSLQLIPNIRQRFIRFHRINGRLYVGLACLISLAGMYLILIRGTVGNAFLHSMTFFSGVLVLVSSLLAIKAIRNKDIKTHQTWAIRLYLAANGVLFFRLMIFAWFLIFGDIGVNTSDFTGPTVYAVSLCSYLVPILIFEWYRKTKRSSSSALMLSLGSTLWLIAVIFLIGLVGISLASWYPSVFN